MGNMKKIVFSIVTIVIVFLLLPAFAYSAVPPKPFRVEINSIDRKAIRDQIVGIMIEKGCRISKDSEYQLSFDKESDNPVFDIFYTNFYTLQKPVFRFEFHVAPMSDKTLLTLTPFIVRHSFTGQEIIETAFGIMNKKDVITFKKLLFKIKSAVDGTPYEELAEELEDTPVTGNPVDERKAIKSGIVSVDKNGSITKIESESIAATAGLQEGDVILEVNLKPIDPNKTDWLSEIDKKLNSGISVSITFKREGEKDVVILKKPK